MGRFHEKRYRSACLSHASRSASAGSASWENKQRSISLPENPQLSSIYRLPLPKCTRFTHSKYRDGTFIESTVFTADVANLISDEEYRALQNHLMANPRAGPVIKGTSGLRKLRWSTAKSGKGKRGGIRVIYYYVTQERAFLMLLAYRKPDQEELSEAQRKALVKLVTMLRTP